MPQQHRYVSLHRFLPVSYTHLVLSCSTLAARIEGKKIVTLEGMQREAQEFGSFLANEGAEQCGFCNPGFIMNVFAMLNEIKDPTEEQIKEYLAGNLCRCSGFVSQTRSILKFLKYKKAQEEACLLYTS